LLKNKIKNNERRKKRVAQLHKKYPKTKKNNKNLLYNLEIHRLQKLNKIRVKKQLQKKLNLKKRVVLMAAYSKLKLL
jgi:hypothetical protein